MDVHTTKPEYLKFFCHETLKCFYVCRKCFETHTHTHTHTHKVKMVVVGRRQSDMIHVHNKIRFLWQQLILFLISRILLIFIAFKISSHKVDGMCFSKGHKIENKDDNFNNDRTLLVL